MDIRIGTLAGMDKGAAYLKQILPHGFESFSTTLLISPYQNHDLLRKAGEEAAKRYGVAFLYRDFRPLFREGQRQAREMGLYMQKYCGCIFSEEERYQKQGK
jgi:predicted adenine nucleotide alpha hydrolase (AANH) superfamily ATPase